MYTIDVRWYVSKNTTTIITNIIINATINLYLEVPCLALQCSMMDNPIHTRFEHRLGGFDSIVCQLGSIRKSAGGIPPWSWLVDNSMRANIDYRLKGDSKLMMSRSRHQ